MLNNLPTHLHKTAISRHILKSKLVKLKAKDEFATSLLFKIENLKKTKSSTEIVEYLCEWANQSIETRTLIRKQLHEELDSIQRINPREAK